MPVCCLFYVLSALRGVSIGEEPKADKHSMGTFSRLREKRATSRPGTSDGTYRQSEKAKPVKVKEEALKEKEKRGKA